MLGLPLSSTFIVRQGAPLGAEPLSLSVPTCRMRGGGQRNGNNERGYDGY
jgi:hypothetical protein